MEQFGVTLLGSCNSNSAAVRTDRNALFSIFHL